MKQPVTYLKIEGSKVWATGMAKPEDPVELARSLCIGGVDPSAFDAYNKDVQFFERSFVEIDDKNSEELYDALEPYLKPIRQRLGKLSSESHVASYGLDMDEFLKTNGLYPAPEGLEMEVKEERCFDLRLRCKQSVRCTSQEKCINAKTVCTLSFSSPKEEPQEESTKQEKPDWDKDSLSQTIKLSELQERNDKLEENLKMAVDRRTEFEALQSHNAQLVEQVKKLEEENAKFIEKLKSEFEKRTHKGSMEVASVGHQWAAEAKRKAFTEAIELLEQIKNK